MLPISKLMKNEILEKSVTTDTGLIIDSEGYYTGRLTSAQIR